MGLLSCDVKSFVDIMGHSICLGVWGVGVLGEGWTYRVQDEIVKTKDTFGRTNSEY